MLTAVCHSQKHIQKCEMGTRYYKLRRSTSVGIRNKCAVSYKHDKSAKPSLHHMLESFRFQWVPTLLTPLICKHLFVTQINFSLEFCYLHWLYKSSYSFFFFVFFHVFSSYRSQNETQENSPVITAHQVLYILLHYTIATQSIQHFPIYP